MQNVYDEVNSLDKKCYDKYFLSEDILMEHAALAMYNHIQNNFSNNSSVLIVCGSGNNGADGIVLARLLYKQFNVKLYLKNEPKNPIAILQKKRTLSLGVEQINDIQNTSFDIVVDCLFGTGLNRILSTQANNIIKTINNIKAYKIACDIPSGINKQGQIPSLAFKANTTITMGALKKSLYTDIAKDYVGDIIQANLGIHRDLFEKKSNCFLVEHFDLYLP